MITDRLNNLIRAYRQTKALIGNANRGKALPGPAFRMCHKVRRAVAEEMKKVSDIIRPTHTGIQPEENPQPATINEQHIEALLLTLIGSVLEREPDFIIGDPEDPYLIRYWLRRDRPEGSIYLHCIRKNDDDRALHDHPWPSTSIVLQGTLREVLPETTRLLTPGSITSRSAESAHRLEIVEGPVWTLFITGAVQREWGFHCPNGWVHWKDFTDPSTNGQEIGKGCGEL